MTAGEFAIWGQQCTAKEPEPGSGVANELAVDLHREWVAESFGVRHFGKALPASPQAFDVVVPVAEWHDGDQFDVVWHCEQFFGGSVLVGFVEGDEASPEAFRPREYFHLLERAAGVEFWSVGGAGVHADRDGQWRIREKGAIGRNGADLL